MKTRLFAFFAAAALSGPQLGAQDLDRCPATTNEQRITQDACQKTIDLFQYMAPQFGIALTGGNATLGQGSTLGGLGHFSVGLRVNVVQGSLPQITSRTPSATGVRRDNYATDDQLIGLPTADLAIGLFKGIPLAITNVGGVDLLVSAAYVPEFEQGGVEVKVPNGSLKLGYGVRVGILQESLVAPGISVTYLRRDFPTTNVTASSGGDSLNIRDLTLKSDAWRVVASKSLLFLGLAVGAGQDKYESSADIRAHVAARTLPPTPAANASPQRPVAQSLTRTNVFGNVSLNLFLLKLTGEIGQVSGGEVNTYNTFDGKQAADSRIYGSIGARFGF